MHGINEYINGYTLSAWISGAIYGLFDEKTYLAKILLLFVAMDFAVGIMLAFARKSPNTEHGGFSSSVCFQGLVKKSVEAAILLMAIGVDEAMGGNHILRDATLLFFIAYEGLSILENAGIAGAPMPPQLKKALEKVCDNKVDKKQDG